MISNERLARNLNRTAPCYPRHTGLPGNTSGNDNQIGTLHGIDGTLTLLIGRRRSTGSGVGQETGDLSGSGDVREIGGDLREEKANRIQRIRRVSRCGQNLHRRS